MKLKPQELARHLQRQTLSLYWIAGDEPLLVQEAADLIRKSLRDAGFEDREIFHIDRSFDWQRLRQSVGNLSLFAERKLVELRLAGALEEAGRQQLLDYLAAPSPDFVLLVIGPRLDAAMQNSKWFKSLETAMGLVPVWPLQRQEMPDWVSRRLLQQGIRATPEAVQLLVDKGEGNLLATAQEIEKLRLLAAAEDGQTVELDARTVLQAVADSARFNVFNLVDAALAGDALRTLKILDGLRSEDTQPLAVVGALNNELTALVGMLARVEQGEAPAAVLQGSRVMFHRKDLLGRALRRLQPALLWQVLDGLRRVDQAVKGLRASDPWDELSGQLLRLCGITVATTVAAGR